MHRARGNFEPQRVAPAAREGNRGPVAITATVEGARDRIDPGWAPSKGGGARSRTAPSPHSTRPFPWSLTDTWFMVALLL